MSKIKKYTTYEGLSCGTMVRINETLMLAVTNKAIEDGIPIYAEFVRSVLNAYCLDKTLIHINDSIETTKGHFYTETDVQVFKSNIENLQNNTKNYVEIIRQKDAQISTISNQYDAKISALNNEIERLKANQIDTDFNAQFKENTSQLANMQHGLNPNFSEFNATQEGFVQTIPNQFAPNQNEPNQFEPNQTDDGDCLAGAGLGNELDLYFPQDVRDPECDRAND